MTEQTTEALIAEARAFVTDEYITPDTSPEESLIRRLATALEADERERDRLDEAFDRDLPWRYDEVEAQRNQLAAVVGAARSWFDEYNGEDPGVGGWFALEVNLDAISAADALREVKAEAIREYVTAARENPHTYYWPPSGVLDDAEQWADEIEKGTI